VNDRLGHAHGDALLRKVADTLLRGNLQPDTPVRLGGDEFALLLPETGYDAARTVMTSIHGLMASALVESGWPVTFTMGAVICTSPSCSAEELIGMADRLMYSRKASGKGGFSQSVL
jgi:diguanylate cyclase (GGDEF)-like protein